MYINDDVQYMRVSTHSRPKAAATIAIITRRFTLSFNTQPPEGGCRVYVDLRRYGQVSTHSRPKAAAQVYAD